MGRNRSYRTNRRSPRHRKKTNEKERNLSPHTKYTRDTEHPEATLTATELVHGTAPNDRRDEDTMNRGHREENRASRVVESNSLKKAGRIYTASVTRAAVTLGTTGKDTLDTAVLAIESRADQVTRGLRIAALFAITAGLILLVPESYAQAQGGGGGSIDPKAGATQIFDVIGQLALIAGVVMAIGSLVARKVMAAMGFALAGGLIWAFCSQPEGTIGGAANWVIEAFTGGGN
jgi:hypothetical protein